jgi:hypothetical protein
MTLQYARSSDLDRPLAALSLPLSRIAPPATALDPRHEINKPHGECGRIEDFNQRVICIFARRDKRLSMGAGPRYRRALPRKKNVKITGLP